MDNNEERYAELIKRWCHGQVSEQEVVELYKYLKKTDSAQEIVTTLEREFESLSSDPYPQDKAKILINKIVSNDKSNKVIEFDTTKNRISFLRKRIWLAAAVILVIATSIIFVESLDRNVKKQEADLSKPDILPGKQGAVLTLADGSQMLLDTLRNKTIAYQLGATVKVENGVLHYEGSGNETVYNTITTPKGRIFHFVLPDGTNAWLNSTSSLKYPVAFIESQRNVSITGEVYFEVAKDKTKPFIVTANNMQVEVLGTHFNINSYSDEAAAKTTLLEGSVKVSTANKTAMLVPGQQAVTNKSNEVNIFNNVDVDQTTAWKDGNFYFKNDNITEIARQLSRWYDANIIIKEPIAQQYTGVISMQNNISAVIKMLELAGGVHFEFEDKNIIITGN